MVIIEGLHKFGVKDAILVVIDRLTKFGHFIPLSHTFSVQSVAKLFLDSIYKLHGSLSTLLLSEITKFLLANSERRCSKCWESLWTSLQLTTLNRMVKLCIWTRASKRIFVAWLQTHQSISSNGCPWLSISIIPIIIRLLKLLLRLYMGIHPLSVYESLSWC